jgi:hypothetical protein
MGRLVSVYDSVQLGSVAHWTARFCGPLDCLLNTRGRSNGDNSRGQNVTTQLQNYTTPPSGDELAPCLSEWRHTIIYLILHLFVHRFLLISCFSEKKTEKGRGHDKIQEKHVVRKK